MANTVIDQVQRLAAFTKDGGGGNPAGVWLGDALPDAGVMQRVATDVGYSETVFAAPEDGTWRVRYFSPQSEVPFCGHATIALGSALAGGHGDGTFALKLNEASISVEGRATAAGFEAALQSPPTRHALLSPEALTEALQLVGLAEADVAAAIAPAFVHAGADHILIALGSADALSNAAYDLEEGRAFMAAHGIVTLALVHRKQDRHFSARNLFASGG